MGSINRADLHRILCACANDNSVCQHPRRGCCWDLGWREDINREQSIWNIQCSGTNDELLFDRRGPFGDYRYVAATTLSLQINGQVNMDHNAIMFGVVHARRVQWICTIW